MKQQHTLFTIFTFFSLFILTTCLLSCRQKERKYSPKQVAFSVQYNPIFDNLIYPSLILGLNSTTDKMQEPTFNLTVTAPHDNAVLRVTIDSSIINYVTIFQEVMPHRGETYTFQPSIKWKYDVLRRLRQSGSIDFTFTCYINDEEVDVKNLRLNYRSVNECPLSILYDGHTNDFRWLFAAYVNEEHPNIENILSEILEQGIINKLSGYQSGTKAVSEQVFAVWYYVLNRGISYSSITCTSNPSPITNVQHIRFFDEVYNTRQANCVDACVFFASILRKIGLKTVIFVEPCHAYLGYYTDKKRRNVALLETTITSWVNFPELEKSLDSDGRLSDKSFEKISKYLTEQQVEQYKNGKLSFDQLKVIVAHSLFDKATTYDQETYQQNKKNFADTNVITYQQLDIENLRQYVQPIN